MNLISKTNKPKASWRNLIAAQGAFIWKNQWIPLIITLIVLILFWVDYGSKWTFADELKNRWNTDIDQVVSFATLMVALLVWYGEIVENWKQTLPKRLTVKFNSESGQLLLLCEKAVLSHEADIRNLGQQIGSQMCENDRKLEFCAPAIEPTSEGICYDKAIGCYLHYSVCFTFTELPNALKMLSTGQFIKWEAPFTSQQMRTVDRSPYRANPFNGNINSQQP